jgi:phospholipase C
VKSELAGISARLSDEERLLGNCQDLGACTAGQLSGIQTAIKLLQEEMTADRLRLLEACAPPPARPQPATNPITHVIVIIQENRSFDELFGGAAAQIPTANIATSVPAYPSGVATLSPQALLGGESNEPGHFHSNFVSDMDGSGAGAYGPNNGWTTITPNAMNYVADNSATCGDGGSCTNVKKYWNLASSSGFAVLADEAFQTNEGGSTTSHCYLVAAQCGYPTSLVDTYSGGCLSPTTASTIDMTAQYPETGSSGGSSCVDIDTVYDLLNAAGLKWAYYSSTGWGTGVVSAVQDVSHICQASTVGCTYTGTGGSAPTEPSAFLAAAGGSSCTLPQVVYVTPSVANSDHGAGTNGLGPLWVESVINAVGEGPCWNSSLLLLTWDDWGGWPDHVVPPRPSDAPNDPYEFGYRIPLFIISPYIASPNTVDHTPRNIAGSILRAIEFTFSLGTDPQCSGTNRHNGAFNPTSPPYYGLCQMDNRDLVDNLYGDLNLSRSPIAFSPLSMTPEQHLRAIASTSDNGASLLFSDDPAKRALSLEAMAYAKEEGWDSTAFRSRSIDDDLGER